MPFRTQSQKSHTAVPAISYAGNTGQPYAVEERATKEHETRRG
jgi:hypothetical protein